MYHLLVSISKRCSCENIEFDLVDLNGRVKQIQEFKSQYATIIFKDRELLLLVKVDSKKNVNIYKNRSLLYLNSNLRE